MNSAARTFLILGAANAALAVLLGAFGAHSLKTHLAADMMAVYQTGLQYHLFHALGLIVAGLAARQIGDSAWLRWSGLVDARRYRDFLGKSLCSEHYRLEVARRGDATGRPVIYRGVGAVCRRGGEVRAVT